MPPPEPQRVHDVKISRVRRYGCARVENIPPEEFGISRRQRSVMLRDCDYCYHEVRRSEAELIADGYDKEQIKRLPDYSGEGNSEEIARDTVDDNTLEAAEMLNRANRQIRVTEHYVLMDYEGDAKPRRYRVTTGGSGEILKRKGKPEIIPDIVRFASMTPVIMTHRFFGRSVADLVMDIQRIKTALQRAALDNVYFANNQRLEVAEEGATKDTIDDVLANRVAGIIRTRRIGSVAPVPNQPIGNFVFPMIEYMDTLREWRTGVTRQGQGLDPNALQNIGERAVLDAQSAARAKTKLIARIFAETGIKEMFWLLHQTIRQNASEAETVKLRGNWQQIDPQEWRQRDDLTINVGLGTGSREQEIAILREIMGIQVNAMKMPETGLAGPPQLYNTLKQLTRKAGFPSPEPYFTDPTQQPPKPPTPKPEEQKAMAEMQMAQQKMQAEMGMKQAEMGMRQQQTQAEMGMAQQRAQIEAGMQQQKIQADAEAQQQKAVQDAALQRQKFEMESELQRERMLQELALKREQLEAELGLKREQLIAELDLKRELGLEAAKANGGTSSVEMGGKPG
jgi:hypothetical protein